MNRRHFVGAIAAGLLAPGVAVAQAPARVFRLGILAFSAPPPPTERTTAIVMIPGALAQMGYAAGQNLAVETRYGDGKLDRLPGLARELVAARCDVIVAIGSAAIRAVRAQSTTIPIVFLGNFDPVALGLVASLSRPGGNLTGVLIAPEGTLAGKKLELLVEAVPRAARVTMLVPADPAMRLQVEEVRKAASALEIKIAVVEVRGTDYPAAFAAITAERPGALFVGAHTLFMRDRQPIIELAARHRLPAIYEWPEQVEDGGLMSYGTSLTATIGRVASHVDRLFRGASPGDLPIEQPTSFQLVINLRTAKALGLSLPPALVARADRVID